MWPILFIVAIIAAIPTAGMSLVWLGVAYLAWKIIFGIIFLLVIGNKARKDDEF